MRLARWYCRRASGSVSRLGPAAWSSMPLTGLCMLHLHLSPTHLQRLSRPLHLPSLYSLGSPRMIVGPFLFHLQHLPGHQTQYLGLVVHGWAALGQVCWGGCHDALLWQVPLQVPVLRLERMVLFPQRHLRICSRVAFLKFKRHGMTLG